MVRSSARRSAAAASVENELIAETSAIEAPSNEGDGVESSQTAPRRGSRAKKPSRAKLDASDLGSLSMTTDPSKKSRTPAAKAKKQEEEEEEEEAQDDPAGPYCICRGVDDGTPMICCADCEDWFHFACIKLSQKMASKISVYRCDECQKKTGKITEYTESRKAKKKPASKQKDSAKKSKGKSAAVKEGDDEGDSEYDESANAGSGDDDDEEMENAKDDFVPESKARKSPLKRKAIDEGDSIARVSSSVKPAKKGRTSVSDASGGSAAVSGGVVIDPQSQAVRSHAVAQFSTILARIFAETSLNGVEFVTLSSDAVLQTDPEASSKEYASTLEETLFDLYGERNAAGHKTTGKQYKDKFRSFVFNLKDQGNGALHLRIASGQLEAVALARLTNEELANDAIRLTVEKNKREALEQSIMKREAAPTRKMTHKGEVDIEFDSGTTESSRQTESRRQKEKEEERDRRASQSATPLVLSAHRRSPSVTGSPTVDKRIASGAGESSADPTPNGVNSLDETNPVQRSPSPAAPSAHDNSGVDISSLFASSAPSGGGMDENFGLADGDLGSFPADGSDIGGWDGAGDDAIDDFLGGGAEQAPVQTERSTTPEAEPAPNAYGLVTQLSRKSVAWKGALTMPEQGTFSGSVRHVAGRDLSLESVGWSLLFPSGYITIEGRLPSQAAIKYLVQSRFSSRTELVVLALSPTLEPTALAQAPSHLNAPTSEATNLSGFQSVFKYFRERQRYGVLPRSGDAARSIKDLYIVPLAEDEPIPEWLELLESSGFDGPRAKRRDADMMLFVAVLFRGEAKAQVPAPPPVGFSGSPYLQGAGAGGISPGGPIGQSGALNDLLSKGPNALQDLLRSLSKPAGSSPVPAGSGPLPATAVSPSQPLSSSARPTSPAGNDELQNTASAMLTMPAPALENMLHANPALVDSLLASLKSGTLLPNAVASPGGPPPPPGPPPAPPGPAPRPPTAFSPQGPTAGGFSPGSYEAPQHQAPFRQQQQQYQQSGPQYQQQGQFHGPPRPEYGFRPASEGFAPHQGGSPAWGAPPQGSPPHQGQGWGRPASGPRGPEGRGRGGRGRGRGGDRGWGRG